MSDAEEKDNKRQVDKEVPETASFGAEGRGPGGKIGQFRIESELGRGGMGVVYLAHDTKLDRHVAIKNLPPEMIANPEVRSRFSREARILASLNHPNIATIYEELEEGEGASYLVLEYVPGDTLSKRIVPGGLKLEETLSVSLQIAEAVAAAHEKGIIHRDLKPGNIKITPEGKVKVLDFGIARTVSSEPIAQQSTVTEFGKIIGTPTYMSPEQVRGQEVDRRSDIWSFGCVLYEMLTGRVPFEGETGSDTLAGILEREPDWQALPKSTPTNIQILLRRCLEKDRRRRLQHIGDASVEISETLNVPAVAPPMVTLPEGISRPAGLRRPMVCGALCLLFGAIAAVAVTYILMKPTAEPSLHIPESLPPDKMLNQDRSEIALSPDGRLLVYVGGIGDSTRLFLSEVGKNVVKELQETKGARLPFFSPDSRQIGFFAEGKLKTLFLDSGRPHPLCDAPHYAGGSWGDDNTIFFSPTWIKGGLRQISTDDGVPKVITDPNKGEYGHWWPEVLPGGEAVLFTIWKTTLNDAQVAVLTLKTGNIQILLNGATHARYASTGHLLYAQSGTLWAAPFDLKRLPLKVGEPRVAIYKGLNQRPTCGYAPFCFSKDCGVLYYVKGGEWLAKRQFVWVNRETRAVEPLSLETGAYSNPCLSPDPDGSRFAFTKFDRSVFNIWVYDFVSKIPQHQTSESSNFLPFWTPDSSKLTFTTYREGPFSVYWKPADGSSAEKPLVTGILDREAFSWSPDGKKLLFVETDPCTGEDIWIYSIEDGNTTRPLLYGTSNEREAVFSPDGDWIAYVSEEEKVRPEVYLTPYPKLAPKKISTDGGCQPLWSHDSNELFYRSGDKMMAATFETEPDFRVTSRVLFEGQYLTGMYRNYDVSKDGQRFLMIKEDEAQSAAAQLMFVFKKRLVPKGKD